VLASAWQLMFNSLQLEAISPAALFKEIRLTICR